MRFLHDKFAENSANLPPKFQFLPDFVKTLQKQSKPFTNSARFCKDFAEIKQLRFSFCQLFGISDGFMRWGNDLRPHNKTAPKGGQVFSSSSSKPASCKDFFAE